ncbi:hypothetical protein QBC46DRAFT_429948, partial [Diplogelasinospora grovesii]
CPSIPRSYPNNQCRVWTSSEESFQLVVSTQYCVFLLPNGYAWVYWTFLARFSACLLLPAFLIPTFDTNYMMHAHQIHLILPMRSSELSMLFTFLFSRLSLAVYVIIKHVCSSRDARSYYFAERHDKLAAAPRSIVVRCERRAHTSFAQQHIDITPAAWLFLPPSAHRTGRYA